MSNKRRVQLTIEPRDGHYEAVIRMTGQPIKDKFKIWVTDHRIQELGKSLRDNLTLSGYELGNHIEWPHGGCDDLYKRFEWIAELGYGALGEIFPNGAISVIKELLNTGDKPTLEILSDRFIFPWELLYDDFVSGCPLSFENFWGYQYIISRQFPRFPSGELSREIAVTALTVGVIADFDLPHVVSDEVPFLRGMEHTVLHELSTDDLDANIKKELLGTRLRGFFCADTADVNIYHFACHTRESYSIALGVAVPGEPPDEYCLWLSHINDVTLWPMDFRTHKLQLCSSPLVILNACATSPRDARSSSSMIEQLQRYGARGVVATECPVSDAVAAVFTQLFYPLILEGVEIGEALWKTRRSLLEPPYNNLSGLMYALYSSPDIRFVLLSERKDAYAKPG